MSSRAVFTIIFSFFFTIPSLTFSQDTKSLAARAIKSTVSIKILNPFFGGYVTGSGFVIKPNTIVTNYHVVQYIKEGFVQRSATDSTVLPIKKLLAIDPINDLAIIEVEGLNLPSLNIADVSLDVGEKVYVCGNPLGLVSTFSDGLVSAKRTINKTDIIQITAPISEGSSGGPVLNQDGKVIGVIFSTIKKGQNLNFVVPINKLFPLLENKNLKPIPLFKVDYGTSNIDSMQVLYSTKYDDKVTQKISGVKLNSAKNLVYTEKNIDFRYIYTSEASMDMCYYPNFEVQATIKLKNDSEGCLIFGDMNEANESSLYYAFQDFYYKLCIKNDRAFAQVSNKKKDTYIFDISTCNEVKKSNWNKLSMFKENDSLYFKINDHNLKSIKYLRNPGKDIGIGGTGPFQIELDKISIKQSKLKIDSILNAFDSPTIVVDFKLRDKFFNSSPFVSHDGLRLFVCSYNYKPDPNSPQTLVFDLRSKILSTERKMVPTLNATYSFGQSYDGNIIYTENTKSQGIEYQTNPYIYAHNIATSINEDFPTINGFYKLNDYSIYSILGNATVLVSSIKRLDSYGDKDIFISHKKDDGTYTTPVNVGGNINTDNNESQAVLSPDKKFLFFSSNGLPGYGKSDLYVTKRLDTSFVNWSVPINLGPKINTSNDENYISFDLKNGYMYFERQDSLSNKILKVSLPNSFKFDVTYVDFDLTSIYKGETFLEVQIYEVKNPKVKIKFIVSKNKSFAWVFENGIDYQLNFLAEKKIVKSIDVKLSSVKGSNTIKLKIEN